MIKWLAKHMRYLADRIDPDGAPRAMGYSFTFETHKGIVFHPNSHTGCPLWYLGAVDYGKAYPK